MALLTQTCTRTAVPGLICAYGGLPGSILVCRCAGGWATTRHGRHFSSHGNRRQTTAAPCQAAATAAEPGTSCEGALPEDDWLQRSRLLVGADGLEKLSAVNVLLVGLGGVGSFAAEFLCRAGVGHMTIVDGDTVDTTNRNRQLPALKSTVGQLKAEVVATRLRDINPDMQLTVKQEFLDPVRAAALVQEQPYHYVVDCIDSVAPKQALLLAGHAAGCKVVSSMGAGGRLDPSSVRLADISRTYNDAFAAVVRRGLRKAGVNNGITVVFSDELAKPASLALTQQQYKKSYFGTCSYIPALFGLFIASHIIRDVVDSSYKVPRPAASLRGSSAECASSKHSRRCNSGKQRQPKQQRSQQLDDQRQLQQQADNSCHQASVADAADSRQQAAAETASASDVHLSRHKQDQQGPRLPSQGQVQDVANVLRSFEQSQGTGMGYDGEGV